MAPYLIGIVAPYLIRIVAPYHVGIVAPYDVGIVGPYHPNIWDLQSKNQNFDNKQPFRIACVFQQLSVPNQKKIIQIINS